MSSTRRKLEDCESHIEQMWVYWDDAMRSWKLLERSKIIKELQAQQIKEWNYE